MISLCKALRSHRSTLTGCARKLFSSMNIAESAKGGYLAVHVRGKIFEGLSIPFYQQTLDNAKSSIFEPGISRFDVLRNIEDPNDFLLIEVYNSQTGPDEHKLTKHYNSWRDAVAPMMAQPRSSLQHNRATWR